MLSFDGFSGARGVLQVMLLLASTPSSPPWASASSFSVLNEVPHIRQSPVDTSSLRKVQVAHAHVFELDPPSSAGFAGSAAFFF
jgi:hypothetical protein